MKYFDNRVVIIHGTYGYPEENWFPWLKSEMEKLGIRVDVPAFPTPSNQSLNSWNEAFESQVGDISKDMILVGHSLGVAFILNLLEKSQRPISGAFLVGGFASSLRIPNLEEINKTFIDKKFNWELIRKNAGFVSVYNSDNDPYVPVDRGKMLSQNLKAALTIIEGGGHINSKAGYYTFPKLLEDIKAHISRICI